MVREVFSAVVLSGWCATALAGPSLCADAAQTATVRAFYATATVPPTFMAATKLSLPEAIVASALVGKQTVGTTGAGFDKVWTSLQAWDDATVVLVKGANVMEVRGRIPPGAPSTRSQFFNLKQEGAGLGGHLRPDELGAIYAIDVAGAQGPVRGITFVDAAGESLFGVYVPEAAEPKPALVAQFEKTRAVIAALARVCPSPGSGG
ncbi:MAG: ChuX/HutX family heme-like substrate-binding protein [Gammaproteobacteria bacterium]